jgi:hypothetical protein
LAFLVHLCHSKSLLSLLLRLGALLILVSRTLRHKLKKALPHRRAGISLWVVSAIA